MLRQHIGELLREVGRFTASLVSHWLLSCRLICQWLWCCGRGRRWSRRIGMALTKQPPVCIKHRIPFAWIFAKDDHVAARLIQLLALAGIELLLQGLLVVRPIHKHQAPGFHIGEVRHHKKIRHRRLGLIRQ